MDKIKVGIVGCGGIANGKHMPSLSKLGDVEMTAFCDIIEERAGKAADAYGAPGAKVFTDYRKLLELKDISVVHVLTPNVSHAEITIAALEAGKHVMCEKPMAKTAEAARAMLEAARRTGKLLSIGYNGRSDAPQIQARRFVEEGLLGDVYYTKAVALRRRGVPCWGVFLNREAQGGGPLIDIGTHIVDLTLWTMNDYSPVVSAIGRTYDELIPLGGFNNGGHWDIGRFEVEDSAFGTVTLASGAMLVVKAAWACNNKEMNLNETLLFGVNGGAELENDRLTFNGESNDRLWTYVPEPTPTKDSMYDREISAWVSALANDTEPVVKCEQAAQVVKVLEAIYISARNGGKAAAL